MYTIIANHPILRYLSFNVRENEIGPMFFELKKSGYEVEISDIKNLPDTRSNGQCKMDGISRQKTRAKYLQLWYEQAYKSDSF